MAAAVRIVGCGHWSMGDDQAGLMVAQHLRDLRIPDVSVVVDETPGTGIAACLDESARLLVIVDAALADDDHPAGTFGKIDYTANPARLRARASGDTHSLGVVDGLRLAASLGVLPPEVWVYVVHGKDVGRSLTLSPEMQGAVPKLAEAIGADVRAWQALGE